MSLEYNPLDALGFGLAESGQSWANIISAIKLNCGVIDQFEFSDEAIIDILKEHVMPFYSIYDGKPMYHRLSESNLLSYYPSKIYKLDAPTKIISIKKVIQSEYQYLSNLGDNQLFGFGGAGIEDYLISRNYNDMHRSIIPVRSWKFLPPNRFEMIDINTFENDYDIVLELNIVHSDPSSVNPTLYDIYLKAMCVGYMKVLVGTIRKQVTTLSTPTGTIEISPDELKQEGMQELQELKTNIKTMVPPETMIYFMN